MKRKFSRISARQMRKLPKGQIHEHLDCSLDPRYMLTRWYERGFENATIRFPKSVVLNWQAAQELRSARNRKGNGELIEKLEKRAARTYQNWLARFASKSLANYVQAVVDHVLPIMQDSIALYEITRKRIQDAVEDGHIFLELRFAPQLHTMGGLTLDQVMDAVVEAVKESPIPVKLIVCSLRHEGDKAVMKHNPVADLVDLAIRYMPYVGGFDLAADEHKYPGVLDWWLPEAERARKAGLKLTIHLWETDEPTATDLERLNEAGICRIGHGDRGDCQGDRVLEVCPTSNVVTGQYPSFAEHPVDRFYRAGKRVTVNTDGTLFTRTDLTGEYLRLQKYFGWGLRDFYTVNVTALEATSFDEATKARLRAKLDEVYLAPRA